MKKYLLVIVSATMFSIGIGILLYAKAEPPKPQNPSSPVPEGVGGSEIDENFYDWETKLNIKFLNLFNEVFPESYDFKLKKEETFEVTLHALEAKYKKDISEFNTDTVECDVYNSKVIVSMDSGETLRGCKVICKLKKVITKDS